MEKKVIKVGTQVKVSGSCCGQRIRGIHTITYASANEDEIVDFDNKDEFEFTLENGAMVNGDEIIGYVGQLDTLPEMEVRITFRSEIYIKGKDMDEINEKYQNLPLFSADALEDYGAKVVETNSVERVDDGSYSEMYLD